MRSEVHPAWAECLHPERWTCEDEYAVEAEVADFLTALTQMIKPEYAVETGTYHGISAVAIARGLKANGRGLLISVEREAESVAEASGRLEREGLLPWVGLIVGDSLDFLGAVGVPVDLFFSDSDLTIRGEEIAVIVSKLSARGVIVVHDTSPTHQIVRRDLDRLAAQGLLSVIHLPTPRGLTLARRSHG